MASLQARLNIYDDYGCKHNILFNSKKSVCFKIGSKGSSATDCMKLNNEDIRWASSCKYLRVVFLNKLIGRLKINITNLRSQTMSTQKITSSTGRRRQLSAGNLIGRHARWIREAVKIRQEAQDVMNRDEGVFLLSHVYDDLLLSAATTAATPSGVISSKKATVVAETSLILGKYCGCFII